MVRSMGAIGTSTGVNGDATPGAGAVIPPVGTGSCTAPAAGGGDGGEPPGSIEDTLVDGAEEGVARRLLLRSLDDPAGLGGDGGGKPGGGCIVILVDGVDGAPGLSSKIVSKAIGCSGENGGSSAGG